MVTGFWANPNLDDGKDTRVNALKEIDESYQRAIVSIYDGVVEDDSIDWEDPFFAAIKKPTPEEEAAVVLPGPDPRPEFKEFVDQ